MSSKAVVSQSEVSCLFPREDNVTKIGLLFQQEWFPLSAWTGAGGRLQGKPRQEPVASSLGVHRCGVAAP